MPRVYAMCQLDCQSSWSALEESWHGVQCWPKTTQPVFQELSTDLFHSEKGPGSLSRSNIQHHLCVSPTLFSPIFPPKSKSSENLMVTDLVTNIMWYYRDPAPVCLTASLFLCLLLSPIFSFKLQCVLGLDRPRTSYFKIYINNVCTFFCKTAHTLLAWFLESLYNYGVWKWYHFSNCLFWSLGPLSVATLLNPSIVFSRWPIHYFDYRCS